MVWLFMCMLECGMHGRILSKFSSQLLTAGSEWHWWYLQGHRVKDQRHLCFVIWPLWLKTFRTSTLTVVITTLVFNISSFDPSDLYSSIHPGV